MTSRRDGGGGGDRDDAFAQTAVGTPRSDAGMEDTAAESSHAHPVGSDPAVPPGTKIGRFVVIEKLGQGGMGVVVAAYDPQLDRRVAIKMVYGDVSEAQRARLEREARAMAQLNHPNVVAVYETGTFEGQLYIAMEYVEGQTLGRWLRAAPRPRAEVLDFLIQAGRGLAAAHAGGLVHRDFKPDNVLVGKDGRVRVSDFGLVSAAGERRSGDASLSPAGPPATVGSLTMTGALMGTPLYMAPEQHDGRVADAKADQFGFCVTAWQAICDDLPYAADSYDQLVANVSGGKLRAPPRTAHVPATLRDLLARGLAKDPAARWASMDALLAALERVRRPRRWPWWLGGGTVLAGGAAAVAVMVAGHAPADPCRGGEQRMAAVWDAPRKAAVADALRAARPAVGDALAVDITGALDAYGASWVAYRRDACLATAVTKEQSPDMLDVRMYCLDRQLAAVRARIARITEIKTRDDAFRARDAELPKPNQCDPGTAGNLWMPTDPETRAKVDALDARTADVVSYDTLGRYAEARRLLDPLIAEVRELGFPPLEAPLVLLRAGGEARDGLGSAAEADFRLSAEVAGRAHNDRLMAQAWSDLIALYTTSGKPNDALALEPVARAATERVAADPLLVARFHNAVGGLYSALQRYPDAKTEYQQALDAVRPLGLGCNLYGPALTNLGGALEALGDFAGARPLFDEARTWFIQHYGPDYGMIAYVEHDLGDLALRQGQIDDAIAHYASALALFERAFGPDHLDVANGLDGLAGAYLAKGDLPKAHELYERELALREHHLGPDHVTLVAPLQWLASADFGEQTPAAVERGLGRLDRAVAILTKAYGEASPQLPPALEMIARGQAMVQHYDAAVVTYTRDLDVRQKTTGLVGDDVSHVYVSRANNHLLLHHAALAAADYALGVKAATTPDNQAMMGFYAARGLWALGKHAEAIDAGKAARAVAPASNAQLGQALDAWLVKPGS